VELPLLGAPLKAPSLLEQEMAEIRSRTARDLVDLRRYVEPQTVKERARQSAVEYLRGIRNALVSNSGSRQSGQLAALVVAAAVALLVIRRESRRDD
jgi:BioD-like phosphotransacetylase family protein